MHNREILFVTKIEKKDFEQIKQNLKIKYTVTLWINSTYV